MASSSAFFRTMTSIVIISILLINSDGWFGVVTVVDATYKCSGKEVGKAYDTDVASLVSQLQQMVTRDPDWKAKLLVGSATGGASCNWIGTSNNCLACLSWAEVNLSVDCKGRESGYSNGLGSCHMSFKRA